jgi:hypothetical protein
MDTALVAFAQTAVPTKKSSPPPMSTKLQHGKRLSSPLNTESTDRGNLP